MDARRLAAGLKVVGRTGQASVRELLRIGLGVDSLAELIGPDAPPVEGVAADGWLGDLLSSSTEHHLAPVATPDSFDGRLRPYQSRGLAWLDFLGRAGLGGVLADDMGLGKTVQLLAWLADQPGTAPTLLVCPMSLVGNWQREAARFAPQLRLHVHHGAERTRGKAFSAAVDGCDLVITTYALAARDATDLAKITWGRVVVDEAQAIKNAATKQATAIRSIPADSRIAVTGTPVENRLADLWSILEFANPGLLGTAAVFKKRYAEPIERHGDDEAAAATPPVHRAVHPAPGEDRHLDHRRPAREAGDGPAVQPDRRAGRRSTRRSSTTCWRRSARQTASSAAVWSLPR